LKTLRSYGPALPTATIRRWPRSSEFRLLLVNVLGPLAAGEKMTPERFDQLLDQISETKHRLAAKLQQQAAGGPVRFWLEWGNRDQ
jgi:hypothetical protein